MLLRALGFSTNQDIFRVFDCITTISLKSKDIEKYHGTTIINDIIDENTGEIFFEGGTVIDNNVVETLVKNKILQIEVVDGDREFSSMLLLNTMEKDPTNSTEEALGCLLYTSPSPRD